MMVHRLLCEAGELFAAAASVGGYLTDDSWANEQGNSQGMITPFPAVVGAIWGNDNYHCSREEVDDRHAVPVLHIHGLNDKIVPVAGSSLIGTLALDSAMGIFRKRLGCSSKAKLSFTNRSTVCHSWCEHPRNLTLCKVSELGHGWPGSSWPSQSTQEL